MQMAQKILRHFYDHFRVKNGFFYSFNVELRGAPPIGGASLRTKG
jgi:hypothetical protein